MSKPYLYLSRRHPTTYKVPVDPKTGESLHEVHDEMIVLHARLYDEHLAPEARKRIAELRTAHQWREVPWFGKTEFQMGKNALLLAGIADASKAQMPEVYCCHPDTFAKMPPDKREAFIVEDADAISNQYLQSK